MSMTFSGQVAVVTGAAAGIGRATALAFAAEGLKVVVADLDVAGGEGTVQSIRDSGGEAGVRALQRDAGNRCAAADGRGDQDLRSP